MAAYVLGGAIIGVIIGHVFPPGSLFWFTVGAACGWGARRCLSRRI